MSQAERTGIMERKEATSMSMTTTRTVATVRNGTVA